MSIVNLIPQTSVPDKNDDFSEFRDQVVELLRDVLFLVGSLPLFFKVSLSSILALFSLPPSAHLCTNLITCSFTRPYVSLVLHGMSRRRVCLSCKLWQASFPREFLQYYSRILSHLLYLVSQG